MIQSLMLVDPATVPKMGKPGHMKFAPEEIQLSRQEELRIMEPIFEDLNARVDQLEHALTNLTATTKETLENDLRSDDALKQVQLKVAQMEHRLNTVLSRVDEESQKVQTWIQLDKDVPSTGTAYTEANAHLVNISDTVKSLTNDVAELSERLNQQAIFLHGEDTVPRSEIVGESPDFASRSVGARILRYGGLTSKIYIDRYGYISRQTIPRTGWLGWVQNMLLPAARLPSPPPNANPPEVVIEVGGGGVDMIWCGGGAAKSVIYV